MARAVVPLNFNAFLEKAKLKDDGSNYTDWVRVGVQKEGCVFVPLYLCTGSRSRTYGHAKQNRG